MFILKIGILCVLFVSWKEFCNNWKHRNMKDQSNLHYIHQQEIMNSSVKLTDIGSFRGKRRSTHSKSAVWRVVLWLSRVIWDVGGIILSSSGRVLYCITGGVLVYSNEKRKWKYFDLFLLLAIFCHSQNFPVSKLLPSCIYT